MDCREYQSQFSAFLDGSLSAGERDALQSHLKTCLPCYRNWSSFQKTVGLLRQLPALEPPEYLNALVMARVKRRFDRSRNWLFAGTYRWLPVGVGIAALLLVSVTLWWKGPIVPTRPPLARNEVRSVTAENSVPPSSPAHPAAVNPGLARGPLVVLKVEDVTRANRDLQSLLVAIAGPSGVQQGLRPLAVSRSARIIHIQVPSHHYPRLMRELVKIGHLEDRGQTLGEEVGAGLPSGAIPVHIVVISDQRAAPLVPQGREGR